MKHRNYHRIPRPAPRLRHGALVPAATRAHALADALFDVAVRPQA